MALPSTPPVGRVIGARYDCGVTNAAGAAGTFYGFKLARDKNGVPMYKESNDPCVSQQYFTGQVGYANFENQKEIQQGQDNWIKGFGLEYQDKTSATTDIEKYYYTANCDARFNGMVILGPLTPSVALPTEPELTNYNFETWTGTTVPTGWTVVAKGTSTCAKASTTPDPHGGSFYCELNNDTGATARAQVYQELACADAAIQGATVTWNCWVYGQGGDCARIGIMDGVSGAWCGLTGGGAWTLATVTYTLNAAAQYCRFVCEPYNGGGGACTAYFDDATAFGYGNVYFKEFNDQLYIANGCSLLKYPSTGGAIKVVGLFPQAITSLEAFSDDRLYVAFGATAAYYQYMTTAEAFTATDSYAVLLKRIGVSTGSQTMKKTLGTSLVYSTTDPTANANWDSGTAVGLSFDVVTGIEEIEGTPYVAKEDLPYYIDTSGNPYPLIPSLSSEKSSTNGANLMAWQNRLYIPTGQDSLYEYDPSSGIATNISPAQVIQNVAGFDGRVTALAADSQWLFAFVFKSGQYVEILAGRRQTQIDSYGNTYGDTWVWHSLAHTAQQATVTGALTSSVYQKMLWYGTNEGYVYWCYLPDSYGYVTSDTTYYYAASGTLITPWLHFNLRGDTKAHIKITLATGNLSAGHKTIAVAYEKFGDSSWTTIGTASSGASNTFYLPADGSGNYPSSTMFRYKFTFTTDTTNSSPILYSYDVRGIWYPAQKRIIEITVRAADKITLNEGTIEDTNGFATLQALIWDWANPTVSYPRPFYPIYYTSDSDVLYCKLLPQDTGQPFGQIIKDENGQDEWVYNLKLLVVQIS